MDGLHILKRLGYVTDGLIECFDGEYNLGANHSGNTSTWIGMIARTKLDYVDGGSPYEWHDKHCRFICETGKGCFVTEVPSVLQGPATMENVCMWESTKLSSNGIPPARCSYMGRSIYKQQPINTLVATIPYNFIVCSGKYINAGTINTLSGYCPNGTDINSIKAFGNGEAYSRYGNGTSTSSPLYIFIGGWMSEGDIFTGVGSVFCFRIYNRELTVGEMNQNRLVDIARFGITYNLQS
jgi:hypothetical protein